ncbi:MAG: hypothetical protein ACTSX6_05325 [Candidatus Heimdallarchaeaceae archaeon]
MVVFIPSLFSVFLSIAFFGLLFSLIFWIIRKISVSAKQQRLRRKLAAASMVSTEKTGKK